MSNREAAQLMQMALANDAPVSDIEAASDAFRTSANMADIIASLDDHDDAAIGRMVRAGFAKALAKQRDWRQTNEWARGIAGMRF